jgi:hypothetical protein
MAEQKSNTYEFQTLTELKIEDLVSSASQHIQYIADMWAAEKLRADNLVQALTKERLLVDALALALKEVESSK